MLKRLLTVACLLALFTSCEEYYTPVIDTIDGQLVVEAQFTNAATKNFVHLTRTRAFYSKLPAEPVPDALVELVELSGNVIQGYESGTGYFIFSTVPVTGRNYKLRISISKDIYESEVVTMPPLPTFNNFYTANLEEKKYKVDAYGVPSAYTVQGREIYVDLPVSNSLANYRFNVRSILEWSYNPPVPPIPPLPPQYGWKSFYENSNFNLAGPKKFSASTDVILKHPLLMLPYDAQIYLQADSLSSHGWILIIEQYGTPAGSYAYHQKLNSQFAADGSLFDPIQTQVYGNITCKTDPSKKVFGYFDLNSYREIRYFMNLSSPNSPIELRQIFRYPFIPDEGGTVGFPPDWWE